MHSSRMRTVRSSSHLGGGGLHQAPPRSRHPPGPDPPPGSSLPREQNDRQVQKYYLAPNFVCGR